MQLLQALSEQAAFINAEVIPWVLRLVMIGLGLSLTLGDFRRVLVFPKAVTVGLVAQLVGLPLTAFVLSYLFGAPPAIAVGLVILAACPSGVTANAYTFASRADVPLCVTLTAITSVITVFSIPFLTGFGMQTFLDQDTSAAIPPSTMLGSLIQLTILPLALGMAVRWQFPATAQRLVEPIRRGVVYLMVAVLLLGVVSSYQDILTHFASAGALVVAMNLLTMGLGFGLARLFSLPVPQVITITFEVGVQNLAMALAITFRILNQPELAVAALIYAAVMPATAIAFVPIARRMLAEEEKRSPSPAASPRSPVV